MPALPDVPKVLKCTMVQSSAGDVDIINRFFIAYATTTPTNLELDEFADDIGEAWAANLAPLISAGVTLTAVEVQDLTSLSSSVGLSTVSHASSRGGSANVLGAACCVSFKVQRRYRGGHPRMYLPAGSGSDLSDSNTWTAGYTAAVKAGMIAFMAAVEGHVAEFDGAGDHVNVSYYAGFHNVTFPSGRTRPVPTLRVTPVVDDVVAYAVNPQVASQRRRNQTP